MFIQYDKHWLFIVYSLKESVKIKSVLYRNYFRDLFVKFKHKLWMQTEWWTDFFWHIPMEVSTTFVSFINEALSVLGDTML